ncbi:MAG: hypothetical protein NZ529_10445 [Cytophagaceae bacterium]|nr:hypothetical protein [Cytophagaceae bacterium]MDW8457205.1 hypothetical protein [Cytophagaceae bacterium]
MYNIGLVGGFIREVSGGFMRGCGVKSIVVSSKLPDWKLAGIPSRKSFRTSQVHNMKM